MGYTTPPPANAKPPQDINICEHLLRVPFPSFPCEGSNFMFDPSMFLGPEKYNDICQYASEQCRAAGFKIYKHNSSKRGSHGSRLSTLVLACEHNREPVEPPKQNKKHYRTCRPADETFRCPFQIKIVCNKKDCCWYLLSQNLDEICESYHKGHIHLPPSTVQTNLSELNEDELDLALRCDELCLPPSIIQKLINSRNEGSTRFTSKQIEHILSRHKAEKIINGCCKEGVSSAEKLIADFDTMIAEGDKIHYVALIHNAAEGYQIRPSRGRLKTIPDESDLNIKEIRESMLLNGEQDILLAFAWVTDVELNMLSKFPHLVTFDVTEKTNKEKRGLFLGTGLDGQKKLFIALHCFMPNARFESFSWIYKFALPELWTDKVISEIEVVITDGENALFSPLENLSGVSGPWKGVMVYRYVIL